MVKDLVEQISIQMKNAKKCNRPVVTQGGVHAL
jgi:activator of 2-hydroxyglutaryl-CoA dehydratase